MGVSSRAGPLAPCPCGGTPLAAASGLRSVYDNSMDLVTGDLVHGMGAEGMTVHPGGAP